MFKLFVCVTLLAVCSAQLLHPNAGLLADGPPEPYSFGFNAADEWGTQWTRQEQGDGSGAVRGSYGYTDAQGLRRIVEYIADAGGYRANIQTNEPGVVSHASADAVYHASH